jgi:hypothetical protein
LKDGHFFAVNRYIPFEEGKPNMDQKSSITYFEDKLLTEILLTINNGLNASGLKRIDKIGFTGWSSHGRKITDLEDNKKFKTTDRPFWIETSFFNQKD